MYKRQGNACYLPRVAGMAATTGSFWVADVAQHFPDRYDHEGWTMPEVMFVWGNNPIVANSDGFFGPVSYTHLVRRACAICLFLLGKACPLCDHEWRRPRQAQRRLPPWAG